MRTLKSTLVNHLMTVSVAAVLAASAGAVLAAPSSYDKEFMEKAADAGATEIDASKLAATNASAPGIKGFAKEMVTDHTAVANELKHLASSKKVTLSDKPNADHQTEIDKLSGLKGDDFDKEYSNAIAVSAHKEAVLLFTNATRKASDPDVKAFAVKTLPKLQLHLDMAMEMHAKMANE